MKTWSDEKETKSGATPMHPNHPDSGAVGCCAQKKKKKVYDAATVLA